VERLIIKLDFYIFLLLCVLLFVIPISNAMIEVSACSAILLWAIKRLVMKRMNKTSFFPFTPIAYSLYAFIFVVILSSVFSSNVALSFRHFSRKTLEYFAIFLLFVDTINNKKRAKIVINVLFASFLLISVDVLVQYFSGFEFLRNRIPVAGRIAGSYEYPDGFGNYLVSFLPLLLVFRPKLKSYIFLRYALLLFFLFFLIINSTKGAWIAFVTVFVFLGFYLKEKRFIAIPIILMLLFMISPQKTKTLTISQFRLAQASILQRIDLWKTSWNMFIDKPIIGQGLGTYMSNFKKYQDEKERSVGEQGIWYAHNSYLQMLAENGILGLFSFLAVIFSAFIFAFKSLSISSDKFFRMSIMGFIAGLFGYSVQIFFDSTFYSLSNAVIFWSILGIVVAMSKINNSIQA